MSHIQLAATLPLAQQLEHSTGVRNFPNGDSDFSLYSHIRGKLNVVGLLNDEVPLDHLSSLPFLLNSLDAHRS